MCETLAPLLLWAVQLSGYPMPESMPACEYRSHAWFVENVCSGKECPFTGLYLNGRITLDEAMGSQDMEAVAVHELVHYLQDLAGKLNKCEMEREAYGVQRKFRWYAHGMLEPFVPYRC